MHRRTCVQGSPLARQASWSTDYITSNMVARVSGSHQGNDSPLWSQYQDATLHSTCPSGVTDRGTPVRATRREKESGKEGGWSSQFSLDKTELEVTWRCHH